MTETKERSLTARPPRSTAPVLLTPSATAMGASSAFAVFGAFLRWFFLGSIKNDLYGVGLGAPPVLAARQALGHFLVMRVGFVLVLGFVVGWAFAQPVVASILIGACFLLALLWFRSRARARWLVIDAATRSIDGSRPLEVADVAGPSLLPSHALGLLAVATDAVRRGDVRTASLAVDRIDEAFLQLDERRLLDGVRALIADRGGDRGGAARLAIRAFPVGAPEVDERLGRILLERNWHDAIRLARAFDEWVAQGFEPGTDSTLGRLLLLIDVKLGRLDPASIGGGARTLEEEARALGDRELADRIRAEAVALPGSRYG